MIPVGSIVNDVASGTAFAAAMIAVCGFLGQAVPALTRKDDQTVRAMLVSGGLVGLFLALALTIVDQIV